MANNLKRVTCNGIQLTDAPKNKLLSVMGIKKTNPLTETLALEELSCHTDGTLKKACLSMPQLRSATFAKFDVLEYIDASKAQ